MIDTGRNVSAEAKDFVKQCLTVDPSKRITADDAMSHPWLAAKKGDTEVSPRYLYWITREL